MGVAHWMKTVLWDATWANNIAWAESLIIAFAFAFFFRDRIGKKVGTWWREHAAPGINGEVHERIADMKNVIDQMNDHIHNGLFDEIHERIDKLVGDRPVTAVTVNIDNEIQESPEVIIDETQPPRD